MRWAVPVRNHFLLSMNAKYAKYILSMLSTSGCALFRLCAQDALCVPRFLLVQCGTPLEFSANSFPCSTLGVVRVQAVDWPLQAAQADRVDKESEVHDL